MREALLAVYDERLKGSGVYLRAVTLPRVKSVKAAVIHATGGRGFAAMLAAHGISA